MIWKGNAMLTEVNKLLVRQTFTVQRGGREYLLKHTIESLWRMHLSAQIIEKRINGCTRNTLYIFKVVEFLSMRFKPLWYIRVKLVLVIHNIPRNMDMVLAPSLAKMQILKSMFVWRIVCLSIRMDDHAWLTNTLTSSSQMHLGLVQNLIDFQTDRTNKFVKM